MFLCPAYADTNGEKLEHIDPRNASSLDILQELRDAGCGALKNLSSSIVGMLYLMR